MKLYVPILKWKAAEILAYKNLDISITKKITPLFEIIPPEPRKNKKGEKIVKSIDEHLKELAQECKSCFGANAFFIDTHYVKEFVMKDGKTATQFIFEEMENTQLSFIPTIGTNYDDSSVKFIGDISKKTNNGVCLRLKLSDFIDSGFELKISKLVSIIQVEKEKIDLLFDLETPPDFSSIPILVEAIKSCINKIPNLNSWRSFIISSCSVPESFVKISGRGEVIRNDWRLYVELLKAIPRDMREPTFSDYGTRPSSYHTFDPDTMSTPRNKIVYTVDEKWIIFRGESGKKRSKTECYDMSKDLMDSEFFMGEDYSYGDKFIADRALRRSKGKTIIGPGNLKQWIEAGTNHHITKVVKDLSKVFSL